MNTKLQFFLNYLTKTLLLLVLGMLIFSTGPKAWAASNNDLQISMEVENASIREVLSAIEAKTGFTFVFDNRISQVKHSFTFQVSNAELASIFKRITAKTGLEFKRINHTISVVSPDRAQLSVNGKVLDSDGLPLPGATVLEVGTFNGTTTDFDGNFTLNVSEFPVNLEISFIGFNTYQLSVENSEPIQVRLDENANALNEVVVTALGIKREEKRLGFSQETVEAENLSQTVPNNWSAGLKGKVSGLNIVSTGSGPINSQQITLRGNNSLNPNGNYALIIVDGVPINTEMTTSGSSSAYMGGDSPVDFGNGISDINLEDIESVSVLKGPGATALYGSRAANGALIITTKSGANQKGLGVSYNTSTTFDVIQRWPDFQYEYGQGTGKSFNDAGEPYYSYGGSEDGNSTGGTSSAWGPRFDGQYYYQYDPEIGGQSQQRQLWRPYKDNRKDFWRTGFTTNNNITLQGGDENGSMRASVGHQLNQWIMPNTGFERITASVNAKYKVSQAIEVGSTLNYNNRSSDNLPGTGYNNGSIAYFMIFQNPNVDLDWLRPIWQEGQENLEQIQPFSSYIDNPFLIAYEATNALASNQLIGNIFTNVRFSPKLNLLLRTSLNTYYQDREQKRPYSINRYARGYFKTQDIWKQEVNADFLLTYEDKISKDISFSVSAGGNAMDYKYRRTDAYIDGLVVPNVYKLANGINNPIVNTYDRNKKINSLYGLASFSFKDMVFLDVTGRNDWSSTLPVQNNSFFYPSANTSIILSDIFDFSGPVDYLKYRFSFAQVGNDTDPYKTSKYYSQNAFPSSAVAPTNLYNANFKPEITTSYETGIEARILKNRIYLDATVYQTSTKNQIISVPLDITTGYSSGVLNSGEVRNRGIELTLNAKVFYTDKFKWTTNLTWARNWNEVLALADGIDGQQEIGTGGQARIIAKVGGTTTSIYGAGFVRSPEGDIVYDNAGLPAYPDDIMYIGDASPDWRAGLQNNFRYGNFGLNLLLDGQYGGIIYSQTHHKMVQQGKLKSTFRGREEGVIIGEGVVLNEDGTYSPNTTQAITPDWYNRYYRRANVESNSFDASYLKLREISLQYNFPKQWFAKSTIQDINLSIFGRNLAVISDFPIYDPETAALNGDTILPGVEMGQMPSPATYGFNLQVNL
ncbi:TonB-linked SusC/RagA family outer membrane protein [Salegentibacter sp. 24]|uniref:SusC/RagA family TonB-linked outer membrane protein n=1 Tax=Salegentibacter sp. 24 TaxID=2183986 RepID=UPI00106089A5|nr:SusC/RagA family TonB-linked outer membrane protein [Salegentibacter sp. 24]TDN86367.1 TonB-linked SusC/RagA family outer membrane protein [Salegentibacter sp. 24]